MSGDFKVPDIDCAESPAETLIYERQPGETCSCARLNAREGAALTYCCSRCPPPTPSIADAQRAAWGTQDSAEAATCAPRPINLTYEQADAEYAAREIRKWGVPGESIVAVWERVSQLANAEVSRRAKVEKP